MGISVVLMQGKKGEIKHAVCSIATMTAEPLTAASRIKS